MRAIAEEGTGVIVVINRPMPGGLSQGLRARAGTMSETDSEQLRDYGVGAQILAELGVHDMILLTNSHHTPVALAGYGLAIVGERPIPGKDD
jgi:3,4-dihydroxy 2-butanone 4-phosphate synthase/GTP cyclohydrolase II